MDVTLAAGYKCRASLTFPALERIHEAIVRGAVPLRLAVHPAGALRAGGVGQRQRAARTPHRPHCRTRRRAPLTLRPELRHRRWCPRRPWRHQSSQRPGSPPTRRRRPGSRRTRRLSRTRSRAIRRPTRSRTQAGIAGRRELGEELGRRGYRDGFRGGGRPQLGRVRSGHSIDGGGRLAEPRCPQHLHGGHLHHPGRWPEDLHDRRQSPQREGQDVRVQRRPAVLIGPPRWSSAQ